jgi:hypothetical protein
LNEIEPPPQISDWNWVWTKWLYNFWAYVKDNIVSDYALEVVRGNVNGVTAVNKFGRSTDVDATDTDIWDRANATDSDTIWTAPTTARTHQIVSTSTSDTSAGAGAKTIEIYGLTSWTTKEVSETITMNGTTNVATTNSYVIIHRMKVLTKGATNTNVGVIKATADTDTTVTAQINAGEGQTQMAVYGIPSIQTAYLPRYYASAIKGAVAVSVELTLLVNPEPDTELLNFVTKHTNGLATDGSNLIEQNFNPYYKIPGPAIIKMQGNGSTTNIDVSAGFDLYLVDN